MGESRNGDGRYTPEHTDAEILAAVRAHEPAATSEVAGEVDMTRQGADRRLRRLRDEGRVASKKIGASLVWFAPDAESGRERAETPAEGSADRSDPSPPAPESAGQEDDERDAQADIRATVEGLNLQGSGSSLEAREDTLVEIVETLREEGSATAGELKDLVDADAVGYKDADAYWANMRTQEVFDALPVETPGRGGRRYHYAGEN